MLIPSSNQSNKRMNKKKLLLSTVFMASVLCLNAQNKGDFSIGFSAGISYTDATTLSGTINSGNSNNNSVYLFGLSFSPEVGYFVANNLKIALSGGCALESEKKEGTYGGIEPKSSTGVFAFGPSVSYYVKLAKGLYYTPELGAFYAFGTTSHCDLSYNISGSVFNSSAKATVDITDFSTKMKGFELTANLLALEYKPSERIGIAISFGQIEYVSLSGDAKEENIHIDNQTIGFRMNTSAIIGLRFYL